MLVDTIVPAIELLKSKQWHKLSPSVNKGNNLVVEDGESEYVIMSMEKYKYHLSKNKANFYKKDIEEAKENGPYLT